MISGSHALLAGPLKISMIATLQPDTSTSTNFSVTSRGIGSPRSTAGLPGSRPVHTRTSNPSTAAVSGCELKLVSNGAKLEVRVRGPQLTPGYWKQEILTAKSFDDEGFYRIGDAVRMVDQSRPELGLVFDGRISEDFKLSTGTWVNVGGLRTKVLSVLAPFVHGIPIMSALVVGK